MAHQISDQQAMQASFVTESADALLRQTVSNVQFVACGMLLGWMLYLGMSRPELAAQIMPAALLLGLATAFSLWLARRHSVLAQLAFQVGLAAYIMVIARWVGEPELLVLLVLLPLVGASTADWKLLLTASALLLLVAVWGSPLVGLPVTPELPHQMIVLAGLLTGTLGWTLTRVLFAGVQRSLQSYIEAGQHLQAYRDQRLQLLQVQEDLVQANRELARLSDRLRTMTQLAEDARRVKEEFVANVSHELRTPLNMIIGFSEVILKSPKLYGVRLPDPLLADIRAIQRNSQHLSGLVNDVLALSQAESGKLVLAREWVNLGELLKEALEAVQVLFESKGLYLNAEVPEQPIVVFCDRLRTREVVLNLLSNAGRFTVSGGVVLRAWQQEDQAMISVADTGPGIAPKDRERIFEPFQRVAGATQRPIEGSGLGLSISKRFVEMHDGRIWLESEVGRGTTFYISLPLEPLPSAPHRAGAARWINPYQQYEARTRRSEAPAPSVTPRFVVMEDGDQLQRVFRQLAEGVEIIPTRSISDLIAESKRSPATAVVINTPDPEAVIADIRAAGGIPFDTPMLVCWIPGEREAARDLGVVRYLVKPISQEALVSAINEAKEGSRTVLVVDDNPEALQLFSRMLASAAAEVRVLRAMSGPQALDLMRARQPDVVLLDLVMPEMDGFQVLREKEKDPSIRQIPVLVVSSLDPMRGIVVSNLLSVSRRNGLTPSELITCIQAISAILTQQELPVDPTSPETPLA